MADHEVIVIGAGFAGLYQLYKLRELGFDTHVIEAGDDVGGTWYWNRYPGARCDVRSIDYSFSFDERLQQEWDWSERFAAQPEILSYAQHVADRFDLRKHISFGVRVNELIWDNARSEWMVSAPGWCRTARFVIAATGCLSVPSRPTFAGMEAFEGDLYWTSSWPADGVALAGKRVAVVGTGSSGLQTITAIAPEVGQLTVFQRTPCYAVPAHNGPMGTALDEARREYAEIRRANRNAVAGFQCYVGTHQLRDLPPAIAQRELDQAWATGGLCFDQYFTDIFTDIDANEVAAEYVRGQIRATVRDQTVAERLSPRTYPFAAKRLCVDTGYYEVYNRDNVELIDINENPLKRFTRHGILAGDTEHEFDVIIMATGFDAVTGALNAIAVVNDTRTLNEKWKDGPRTYLGLMSAGFPNLFIITGPQSPSVFCNMITAIEQHVEWISDLLTHARDRGFTRIDVDPEAEDNWVNTNNDLGDMTILAQAASWWRGANIPGKKQVLLAFAGGLDVYQQVLDGVAVSSYHGFELA